MTLQIILESVFLYYSNFAIPELFHIKSTSEENVFKIMENIEIFEASGIDKLPGRFLKGGVKILSKPISEICNLSISHGIFPNASKVSKLKPIFKKGKKLDPSNYRPISLLPLISKILGKVAHDQANKFLSANKILYNYQSGFRTNHPTNLCLSFLTDKNLKGFDEGLLTRMILIDLQKAFETINHEILLKKLEAIGFSDQCIRWFRSYLYERLFSIEIENQLSDFGKVSCGVPQGSILRPLLFLIYVNDMPQAVKSNLFLYADDSCLMYQHKDVSEIEEQLNKDFENVCDWFVDNKLSIHFGEDKTKSILFASKRKIKSARKLNVKYKNIKIKQHSQVTYLGCVLDETLCGEPMTLKALNKINEKLKFLYRQNKFLTPTLYRMLCNAIIQPHFDYACSAWYPNLNEKLKKKIQIAQNNCIWFCLKLDKRHHISSKEF